MLYMKTENDLKMTIKYATLLFFFSKMQLSNTKNSNLYLKKKAQKVVPNVSVDYTDYVFNEVYQDQSMKIIYLFF